MQSKKNGKIPFSAFYYEHKDKVTEDLYIKCKGNTAEIAERFNELYSIEEPHATITRQTVLKWLKEKGLETNPHGGYRHGVPERIFRKVHKKAEGKLSGIEWYLRKKFKISREQIKTRCRRNRIPYY